MDHLVIAEDGLGLCPVGLVAGDAVAAIGHLEREAGGAREIDVDAFGLHPFAHQRRTIDLSIADADDEDDAAPPSAGLLVGVHTDRGVKGLPGAGKVNLDLARGVAIKAATRQVPGNIQRSSVAGVAMNRVVVGQDDEAVPCRCFLDLALEPGLGPRRAWFSSFLLGAVARQDVWIPNTKQPDRKRINP